MLGIRSLKPSGCFPQLLGADLLYEKEPRKHNQRRYICTLPLSQVQSQHVAQTRHGFKLPLKIPFPPHKVCVQGFVYIVLALSVNPTQPACPPAWEQRAFSSWLMFGGPAA